MKQALIAQKMREILEILGLDLNNPSLAKTPQRIAKMYTEEIFTGLDTSNFPQLTFQEDNVSEEMVLVKNISFVSFCEHHFVPIVGRAHVAYFPHKRVLGLSKIPHIIRYFAKRPQLQERLTLQIADSFTTHLETEDVAILLQATHFCIVVRDVEDMSAEMETHILRGRFQQEPLRSEFFHRISV